MNKYNNYIHAKYDSDYNGILHNYKDIYSIKVSSTNFNDQLRPGYLIDNITNRLYYDWCSINKLYEYIQIDFRKPYTFTPASYTFAVRDPNGRDAYNPINWTVQGLIGQEWKNISEVRDSPFTLINMKTFTIDNYTENLNSIRFMQTSPNSKWNDPKYSYIFCLVEIEIFGIIRKGICQLSLNLRCVNSIKYLSFISVIIVI